jgi:hypothetical protein
MTRHANPRDRVAEAELDRIQAAAKAAGCGPVFVCGPPAGEVAKLAEVLFPWLGGPAEPEREAEL